MIHSLFVLYAACQILAFSRLVKMQKLLDYMSFHIGIILVKFIEFKRCVSSSVGQSFWISIIHSSRSFRRNHYSSGVEYWKSWVLLEYLVATPEYYSSIRRSIFSIYSEIIRNMVFHWYLGGFWVLKQTHIWQWFYSKYKQGSIFFRRLKKNSPVWLEKIPHSDMSFFFIFSISTWKTSPLKF